MYKLTGRVAHFSAASISLASGELRAQRTELCGGGHGDGRVLGGSEVRKTAQDQSKADAFRTEILNLNALDERSGTSLLHEAAR